MKKRQFLRIKPVTQACIKVLPLATIEIFGEIDDRVTSTRLSFILTLIQGYGCETA